MWIPTLWHSSPRGAAHHLLSAIARSHVEHTCCNGHTLANQMISVAEMHIYCMYSHCHATLELLPQHAGQGCPCHLPATDHVVLVSHSLLLRQRSTPAAVHLSNLSMLRAALMLQFHIVSQWLHTLTTWGRSPSAVRNVPLLARTLSTPVATGIH